MPEQQKLIFEQVKSIYGRRGTLEFLAEQTGINKIRVHRIRTMESEMMLSEYFKFLELLRRRV